jgi:hypothetical protein
LIERKKNMEKQNLTVEEKRRKDYLLDKEIELKWQKSVIKQELLTSAFFMVVMLYVMKVYVDRGGNPLLLMIVLIIEILDLTKNISNLVHEEAKSGLRLRIILKYILRVLLAVFILNPFMYSKTITYLVISVIGIIIGVIDDAR